MTTESTPVNAQQSFVTSSLRLGGLFSGRPSTIALEQRRLQCYLALILADIAALFAGFAITGWLYLGMDGLDLAMLQAQLVLPIFLTIALYNGAYSMEALIKPGHGLVRALLATMISASAVVFFAFYTRTSLEFSRVALTLGTVGALLAQGWTRLQMRSFVHWRCGPRVVHEILIDDEGPAAELPGVPVIKARAFGIEPILTDPAAMDRIGLLLRNVDRAVVTCPAERRAAWAIILRGANVEGELIDEAVTELGAHGARVAGGQGWLRVSVGPLGMRSRIAKRLFDLFLAGSALLALSPLLLLVALLIQQEDGGPALFVQRRVGRGNRFFAMYKFRSMKVARLDGDGTVSTARDDDRVTRIGRFIRRTSIDELPQLINVLKGDMSLVGPRPHAIASQAGDKLFWEVDSRYWQRHALKPGLTGLAQIRGFRGATEQESDLSERLRADLEYLDGWSLWRDIAIIFATTGVLVHDRAF